jgi:asparagine synthase (glutamine-hydrolysing)
MDEPFADPSLLPTSLLSKFARESVTVALGGDGGDELFAGYDPFKALVAARIYDAVVPSCLHGQIAGLSRITPGSGANMSLSFRVERFLRGAKVPEAERMTSWLGSFDAKGVAALLDGAPEGGIRERFLCAERTLFAPISGVTTDSVRNSLAYFQSMYLIDDILVKADRASMMHSLELRSPFLDTALAEFVNSLPSHYKCRGVTTKYILKKLLARGGPGGGSMVPEQLIRRRKKGFGIPISRWIRGELRGAFSSALVAQWPDELHFLRPDRIRSMLELHVSGARDLGKELWALYMLAGWVRNWVK